MMVAKLPALAWLSAFVDKSKFHADLNRAICECIANMQAAKTDHAAPGTRRGG